MDEINIGFIGLGNMGHHMCLALIQKNYNVTVHDINREAALPALELGAAWADTPRELAQKSDIIFTSLPGPTEVEAVATGEDGIIDGITSDSVWADLSTSSPELMRRLQETFSSKGASILDAPVSGRRSDENGVTLNGVLSIMVGGHENIYLELKPIFESFGNKVTYTGEIGSATICKLANNMFQYGLERLLVESLTLGVKAGVPAEILMQCIRNGAGGSGRILNVSMPDTYLQGKFDGGTGSESTFPISRKDMALALELGRELNVPLQIATGTYNDMTAALNRKEWADLNYRVYHLLQEERAGNVEVRIPTED
ncbi:MAG TPA: NAD(P)-dependent oxidoreductase [SAR202 cluster bacterium]|jgi:3-hydroxyisobutyrate dehydrogenase|nr:NAD(P)-dependent oxidoreductase [SAR202 cluster bacterium]|tara:strand:- start:493 stop:1434 length:942 start_codon:yes stop_codon:yes gene_type:complete